MIPFSYILFKHSPDPLKEEGSSLIPVECPSHVMHLQGNQGILSWARCEPGLSEDPRGAAERQFAFGVQGSMWVNPPDAERRTEATFFFEATMKSQFN